MGIKLSNDRSKQFYEEELERRIDLIESELNKPLPTELIKEAIELVKTPILEDTKILQSYKDPIIQGEQVTEVDQEESKIGLGSEVPEEILPVVEENVEEIVEDKTEVQGKVK